MFYIRKKKKKSKVVSFTYLQQVITRQTAWRIKEKTQSKILSTTEIIIVCRKNVY